LRVAEYHLRSIGMILGPADEYQLHLLWQ